MSDLEPIVEQHNGAPIENFLDSAKELKRLQDKVTKSNGNVRIFVHPFFAKNDLTSVPYGEPLKRLLDSTSSDIPPIIVMEGKDKVEATRKFLREHSSDEIREKLFIIPTIRNNDPEPFSSIPQEGGSETRWKLFIEKLKDAGVKKALVGGTNLSISPTSNGRLFECVGIVVGRLKNYFEVEVSNIAAPKRRVDLIKS